MPIVSYRSQSTRDIAINVIRKQTLKTLPIELHAVARRRLAFLAAVTSLDELRLRSGIGLHKLKGDRAGQHAIRINDQYRICFVWNGTDAELVEITDYH